MDQEKARAVVQAQAAVDRVQAEREKLRRAADHAADALSAAILSAGLETGRWVTFGGKLYEVHNDGRESLFLVERAETRPVIDLDGDGTHCITAGRGTDVAKAEGASP